VMGMHSEKRSRVDLESGVTPLMICHPLVHVSATNMEGCTVTYTECTVTYLLLLI
jgi:hypothetical protein